MLSYFYSMAINLSSVKEVYFIGIGGIGISAIARLFLLQGKQVTGSDLSRSSPILIELRKAGAKIFSGHRVSQLPPEADLVIYSLAIPAANVEYRHAQTLKIPLLSYPQALGLISKDKFTIAVSGTHGKTTTTAMIGEIFQAAKLSPTVIVGSLLNRGRTNLVVGQSKYLVAEACEYRESFLNLSPQILVITNIDNDHLDYYKNLRAIQRAFARLAAKVPTDGFLICDRRDPRLAPVLTSRRRQCKVVDYREVASNFKLLVPGDHNRANAQAALAVATTIGISSVTSVGALNKFNGTWRRLEYLGRTRRGARLYDDYAHHPTEIRATLAAVRRDLKPRRLIAVFQPHLYSRTKLLFHDLAATLAAADEVLLLPIYAAREKPDQTINSRHLAAAVDQAGTPTRYFGSFQTAEKYLNQRLGRGELLLTMGAGDIYVLAQALSVKK